MMLVRAGKATLQALNKIFWKVPPREPGMTSDQNGEYWVSELRDGGVVGIAWSHDEQAFIAVKDPPTGYPTIMAIPEYLKEHRP